MVEQSPLLLPSLLLPDLTDIKRTTNKGDAEKPELGHIDLLESAEKAPKISSLDNSGKSVRSARQSLQRMSRDPTNERYIDPLAPATQIDPQTSSQPPSFITRVLRR